MNKIKNPIIEYAILFCGGKGSRLGSIGKKKNKSLILVHNKPIIYYIISKLLKSNINKIIFPLGYKGNDIKIDRPHRFWPTHPDWHNHLCRRNGCQINAQNEWTEWRRSLVGVSAPIPAHS